MINYLLEEQVITVESLKKEEHYTYGILSLKFISGIYKQKMQSKTLMLLENVGWAVPVWVVIPVIYSQFICKEDFIFCSALS